MDSIVFSHKQEYSINTQTCFSCYFSEEFSYTSMHLHGVDNKGQKDVQHVQRKKCPGILWHQMHHLTRSFHLEIQINIQRMNEPLV